MIRNIYMYVFFVWALLVGFLIEAKCQEPLIIADVNGVVYHDTLVAKGLMIYDTTDKQSYFYQKSEVDVKALSKRDIRNIINKRSWWLLLPEDLNYIYRYAGKLPPDNVCTDDEMLKSYIRANESYRHVGKYIIAYVDHKFILLLIPKWLSPYRPSNVVIRTPPPVKEQQYIKGLLYFCW